MVQKRGPKPKGRVEIKWSADFAYAIGLLVTDGNVSKDGRHITFTSKDIDQVKNFMKCLGIDIKIGINVSGSHNKSWRVQFSDVSFYDWLIKIGLMQNKSKIIGKIDVPDKYFFDLLRGCFDGDGSIYSYFDSRWKSSFMFYVSFISASKVHIFWLQSEIMRLGELSGHITKSRNSSVYQLKFAKKESIIIIKKMYYKTGLISLRRKRLKIKQILAIVDRLSKR